MPSRAKTVVDGFEWEDEFLAWTNSHGKSIIPDKLYVNILIQNRYQDHQSKKHAIRSASQPDY